MSKVTIFEAAGIELFERETFHPVPGAASPTTTVQIELEVGGWVYSVKPDDADGIEELLAAANRLQTSLGELKMVLRTRLARRV